MFIWVSVLTRRSSVLVVLLSTYLSKVRGHRPIQNSWGGNRDLVRDADSEKPEHASVSACRSDTDSVCLPACEPLTPSSWHRQHLIHLRRTAQHPCWPGGTRRSIVSLLFNTAAPQSVSIWQRQPRSRVCVCVCSMSIIFLCWCRPLMVNKLVSTRSPHPPLSLPPSSLFKCNWHDSYTSSSLSSQRALKNEPSRCALKWLIFRAILCWIVMFTCVTSRFFSLLLLFAI